MATSRPSPRSPALVNKRSKQRAKRRFLVRYGVQTATRMAFTTDLSETGAFLQAAHLLPPGTEIRVQLDLQGRTFHHTARVEWAKDVAPRLAHLLGRGMGIRFLEPSSDWSTFFSEWASRNGLRSP